jgi:hypothetical protein
MATGMLMDMKGVGRNEYLEIHRRLALDETPVEGLLLHSAGPIQGGWRIFDVWESPEAFERFTRERIMPAAKEAGLEMEQQEPQLYELENVWTPGADELSRMGASSMPEGARV